MPHAHECTIRQAVWGCMHHVDTVTKLYFALWHCFSSQYVVRKNIYLDERPRCARQMKSN
jgi:hypothetical protein